MDAEARQLFDAYRPLALSVARGLWAGLRHADPALQCEDLEAAALVGLWGAVKRPPPDGQPFAPWAVACCRNECLQWVRRVLGRHKSKPGREALHAPEWIVDASSQHDADRERLSEAAADALALVPREMRADLLARLDGALYQDLADWGGLTKAGARLRVKKAIAFARWMAGMESDS